jgi:hypothetical protein
MTQPPPIQPARPSLPPAESWLAGVPTPAQQRQDGYAVAALVTSLPGLVPIAVVLAGIALRRIKRTGSRGKRLAYGALAISLCWMIAIGVAVALGLYGERRAGIGRTVAISEVAVQQCFDADLEAETQHNITYEWNHPLGEVVSAVVSAGLTLEFLHEYDYTMFPRWPFLDKSGFDTYRPPEGKPKMPLMYSLRARKA